MAKATGGASGAQLASGFISLNVKYGSAMKQIADDFGVMDKKSKAVGESITKNLVSGVDSAKAKVKELGTAYEEQRTKVASLKDEVNKLNSAESAGAQAKKAYREAFLRDKELEKKARQESINLQLELNAASSEAAKNIGELGKQRSDVPYLQKDLEAIAAIEAKRSALMARRKEEMEELNVLAKASTKTGSKEALEAEAAKRQELNDELAKGKSLLDQYGKAVEDVKRKQQLVSATTDSFTKSVGGFRSMGQRFAKALGLPFGPELKAAGEKAGRGFRMSFTSELGKAKSEASQGVKRMASGLWMGMTPGVMGAAGVGLAVGKAFSAGFNREETMNTVKLQLGALGTSAENINNLMSQAQGSVEGTQFNLAESFSAASTAMQANIKIGPDMVQYLNNIANAAGLTGESYETVADSIGRVQRQGYVSLENIQPLINKNMPILQWLHEFYKKDFPNTTQSDITDMISKKMIPADVMQKVLTANLNDGMKVLTKSTVKGATADLFTQVGKVTQSILQPFMGDLPTFINGLGDKLRRFAEYIKPGMAAAAAWISRTWNDLWPKVTRVFGAAVDWITEKWNEWWPTISRILDIVKEKWNKLWPELAAKFQPWLHAFKRLWNALYPIVAPILKGIGALAAWLAWQFIRHMPAFIQFATNLINWMATVLDWLRVEFFPWLKNKWEGFVEWVDNAIDAVVNFKDEVVKGFNWMKDATIGTWTWLEDKIGWLTGLKIPGFIADLLGLEKNSGGGSSSWTSADGRTFESVNAAFSGVPKPARLRDSGHVGSGPQSRHVAGLLLEMFPGIKGDIGGSYLPMKEGGPSVPGTHDAGLSIDIPIGTSADQRGMGDRIEKYLQENAKQLGIVYTIWKDRGKNTGMGTRAGGTEFFSGGHQDHIDVMFDGKTFSAAVADQISSAVGGFNWDAVAAKESSGDWDNNNTGGHMTSSGAPRGGLQITDGTWNSYGGTEFAKTANLASKAQQIAVAERIAFHGYNGVKPQGLSAWEVITNGSTAADGITVNSKPPRRQVSINDFGGQQNLSVERPLSPWGTEEPEPLPGANFETSVTDIILGRADSVVPQPLSPSITDAILGRVPDTNTPAPGIESFPRVYGQTIPGGGMGASTNPLPTFWDAINPGKVLNPYFWIDYFLDKNKAKGFQNPMTGNLDSGAGHGGVSGRERRGLGPKGTKDDPIVTTDPEVADNTDPENQKPVDPGAAAGDSSATTTADEPHAGSGAQPGPVEPGAAGGQQDLAEGLGGVATTAFSDQFAGTPFSDPLEWPAVKSAGALLSFFGGILSGDGSGAAGGLTGMIFPGSRSSGGGGEPASARQIREAGQRVTDTAKTRDDIKREIDAMEGKANFTEQDKLDIADRHAVAQREAADALTDQQELLGKGQGGQPMGGLMGMFQNMLNPNGTPGSTGALPGMPGAPGGAAGFTLQPFGDMLTGTPGAAPGDGAQHAFTPGGAGTPLAAVEGMIPNAANAAPPQQHGQGSAPGPSLTINQAVTDASFAEGQSRATRVTNMMGRSAMMQPVFA